MTTFMQSISVTTETKEQFNKAYHALSSILNHMSEEVGAVHYSSVPLDEHNAGLDGYKLFDVVDIITGVMGCDMTKARDLLRALQSHNFYVEERH